MSESAESNKREGGSDVVICGGGLAGLLLARQIRQEHPDAHVTVLEKSKRPLPDACHKVGESSVELGSQYLERLGLTEYLLDRHLVKLGLRFFPGGGDRPLVERTEIGPCAEPIVRSYQLDRGRLEGDLRGFLEDDGVALIEGARVREIKVGEGTERHIISYGIDGSQQEISADWVVDATGRVALLRRHLKLTRGSRHPASAGWFRISGKFDINDLVPASEEEWHRRACADERWRSTNHFMGAGYWAWVIPLSTGHTSIGVVIHEEMHDFHEVSSIERVRDFLERHEPVLAKALANEEARDFLCLRNYSHGVSRSWSADRWAIVGEAGAFVDPLYSPGTDFIALANCFTSEMMRVDQMGGNLKEKAGTLNTQYRSLVTGATEIFRQAAPVYGHAQAMAAKVYWDNLIYWSFTCQYFQQNIWRLSPEEQIPFSETGRRFLELSNHMQLLFRTWAELAPPRPDPVARPLPKIPSLLIECHTTIAERMTPEETLEYIQKRTEEGRVIAGEMVLRIVQELGPELGQTLLERVRFPMWEIEIPPDRIEMETLDGMTRRRTIPSIARDVERCLGPMKRHPAADEARELLAQGTTA